MQSVWQDLRFSWRTLKRSPLVSGVSLVTLALAIGATGTVFGAVYATLLRPLPFEDGHQLYAVNSTYQGARREFVSLADMADWRAQSRAFSHMAAIVGEDFSITTPMGPEYLIGARVSEDFFELFGMKALLGRGFAEAEHRPGRGRAVVLSHGLWVRRFGADPTVIGSVVELDGEANTVVGVLSAGAVFPEGAELWRPLASPTSGANRRARVARGFARKRPEVSLAAAQAELAEIGRRLEQQYPASNAKWGAELFLLSKKAIENVEPALLALSAAVVCVLLIACANIGIMLLSIGRRREAEFATRAAIGAGRGRLVGQVLRETALLGLLGGVGGILLAAWGLVAIRTAAPAGLLRPDEIGLNLPVFAFTAVLSIGTGMVIGVVPALWVARSDPNRMLKDSSLAISAGSRQHVYMRCLAAAQIAASVVLLTTAGLMVRTLQHLHSVELGFNPERLLTFYVALPDAIYRDDTRVQAFYDELLTRLRALPGVDAVSSVNALYVHWSDAIVFPVRVAGAASRPDAGVPDTHLRIVDPDIHRVLQIPVLRGRALTRSDGPGTPLVAVVTQRMAQRDFPNQDPLGHRIALGPSSADPVWYEIVGIVGDVMQRGPGGEAFAEVQIPFAQSPMGQMAVLVKTARDPASAVSAVRDVLHSIDPDLPMTRVQTMDDVVGKSLATRTFATNVMSAFAAMALLLSAIGLYAVMAATVGAKSREIAVRIAFGASPRHVVAAVVGQACVVAAIGMVIGVTVALGATRYLESQLVGVSPVDPVTFGLTLLVLSCVALAGAYLPAKHMSRIDVAATLRL